MGDLWRKRLSTTNTYQIHEIRCQNCWSTNHPQTADGLALSSRNVRLSDSNAALVIYRALLAARNEKSVDAARAVMQEVLASEEAFTLDYAEIINESNFGKALQSDESKRAIIAGWVNGIRLIDNMPMNGGAQ
jgi:pantoate--beta-alanine ligase